MTNYRTYVVHQGDTLQSIASRFLGTPGRWREIAALNSLRAPYISDSPADWYGAPVAVGVLADDIVEGDTEVTITGERADLLEHGAVLFLDGQDGEGRYVYSAPRIDSYDEGTGIVALLDAIDASWSLGGRYRVCPPQEDLQSGVARSGATIALPLPTEEGESQVLDTGNLIDLFGTDIALPADGRLRFVGGDLVAVQGIANAEQALRMKAQMPFGDSLWHPELGNKAVTMIGEPISPATAQIAALYTRAALAIDPRVREVPRVAGTFDGPGAILVSADVTLIDNNRQIQVNALLRDKG